MDLNSGELLETLTSSLICSLFFSTPVFICSIVSSVP